MMIKGRFGGELHHYAVFWGKTTPKLASKLAVLGVKWALNFKYWFHDRQKAPRLSAYFASKSVHVSWL